MCFWISFTLFQGDVFVRAVVFNEQLPVIKKKPNCKEVESPPT